MSIIQPQASAVREDRALISDEEWQALLWPAMRQEGEVVEPSSHPCCAGHVPGAQGAEPNSRGAVA